MKRNTLLHYLPTFGICPIYRSGVTRRNFYKHSKKSVEKWKRNGFLVKEILLNSYQEHLEAPAVWIFQDQKLRQMLPVGLVNFRAISTPYAAEPQPAGTEGIEYSVYLWLKPNLRIWLVNGKVKLFR